jgi:hypothetical protein
MLPRGKNITAENRGDIPVVRHFLFNSPLIYGLLLAFSSIVCAQEDESKASPLANDGKHLLSMGYTIVDGFDGDINVLATGYTYSSSRSLRYSATTQFMELTIPAGDGPSGNDRVEQFGLGDSIVSVQYDPNANLTSSPWIPDRVGLFGALLLPTGDSSDGLSGDAWGATVGAGWPIPISDRFLIVPSGDYTQTFSHGDDAVKLDELWFSAELLWLAPYGVWVGVQPFVSWDFEHHESVDAFSVVIGKTFSNGLGLHLQWGDKRRYENYANADDEILLFNLSWQFGPPPRD